MLKAKEIKDAMMKEDIRKEKHEMELSAGIIEVWVHELTSYQLETWRGLCHSDNEDMQKLNAAKLLQMALHDEAGNLVWEVNEIAILAGRPSRIIEPLVRATTRLSGYGEKGAEAILKNLAKILGAVGLSGLLVSSDAPSGISTGDTQPTSSESST